MNIFKKWFGKNTSNASVVTEKQYEVKESNELAEYESHTYRVRHIQDDRKFERENLGLNYKTEDELTPVEKQQLDKLIPDEAYMKKAVKELQPEPFGAPGITDTTKYDGNLAEQYLAKGSVPDELKKFEGTIQGTR